MSLYFENFFIFMPTKTSYNKNILWEILKIESVKKFIQRK